MRISQGEGYYHAICYSDKNNGWVVDNFSGILHTNDGGVYWRLQISGTRLAITSVQFVDSLDGWATATNRVVLHTIDGGNNWTITTLDNLDYGRNVTVVYSDIFSYGSRTWIATDASPSDTDRARASVVFTPDAGRTWICQWTPEVLSIPSIHFVGDNLGWAGGWNGILHTSNGGYTWDHELESHGALFVDICFLNQSRGWAITFLGDIYRYEAS